MIRSYNPKQNLEGIFLAKDIKDQSQKKVLPVVHSQIDERFYSELKIVARKHSSYLRKVETSPPFQISTPYLIFKRCLDIFAAIIGLILFSPLFLVVAILIKLGSKGPVFFSQERVGKNGQIFRMHKFRTMVQDAEWKTGPIWAKKDDPRVTYKLKTWVAIWLRLLLLILIQIWR